MNVTEQAEEQRTGEAGVPEPVPAVDATPLPPPVPERSALGAASLRLAYAFEFWIALIAIFTVWSQVGGQAHLDLVAWYIKLACAVALAWSAVKMTGAMVENQRAWNRATAKWFAAVLILSGLIIGITYWYHLHEVLDEPDTDENSATSVRNHAVEPAAQFYMGVTAALTGFDPTGIIMNSAPRRLRQRSATARIMLSVRITAMSPDVSFNTRA